MWVGQLPGSSRNSSIFPSAVIRPTREIVNASVSTPVNQTVPSGLGATSPTPNLLGVGSEISLRMPRVEIRPIVAEPPSENHKSPPGPTATDQGWLSALGSGNYVTVWPAAGWARPKAERAAAERRSQPMDGEEFMTILPWGLDRLPPAHSLPHGSGIVKPTRPEPAETTGGELSARDRAAEG